MISNGVDEQQMLVGMEVDAAAAVMALLLLVLASFISIVYDERMLQRR